MSTLHLDYEVFSRLDLKKVGSYRYAAHSSTEVLMLGWALDDEPVELWQPRHGPMPSLLFDALRDPDVIKKAFNAQFERLITKYVLGIEVPIEQWRCVMVKSFYLSFTGGLSGVLKAIGLPQKDDRGGRLINMFSKPAPKNHHAERYDWNNRPAEWDEFCEYCITDVETERELDKWLDTHPGMHSWDWEQWFEDQRINDRGVQMDVEMAEAAIDVWADETQALKDELAAVTGLSKVTRGPFLQYLNDNGIDVDNTRKDTLQSLRRTGLTEELDHVVSLWLQKEAKATSKYTAIANAAGDDYRARGMFQYKGAARTDRVGGRLIQLQNLKRPFVGNDGIEQLVGLIKRGDRKLLNLIYDKPVADILGGSIRHAITAKDGHSLVIADLSSIESVVLGWVADCKLIDQTFRSGKDSYKVFASQYYDIPYDQVTKAQRSFSKPPVLGCGYMLGWKGLMAYAEGYGVDMSEDESRAAVDTFRNMYPEIVQFWHRLYEAVKWVTMHGGTKEGYRMKISRCDDFLRILLPSGRNLSYFKPEVIQRPAPWDRDILIDNFSYMGTNDNNQWTRICAHAGLITENIVQSLAGDILWSGIMQSKHQNLSVVLHVHDEIGCEEPDEHAVEALGKLIKAMTTVPTWAQGMWLGADGFITKRYTKD